MVELLEDGFEFAGYNEIHEGYYFGWVGYELVVESLALGGVVVEVEGVEVEGGGCFDGYGGG